MKYITIDIGSTFIKSALLDTDTCTILEQNKIPTPERLKREDSHYFEINAEQILELVKMKIHKFTLNYKNCKGVIFSTQMHGFIYSSGEYKNTYVSWQDTRCLKKRKNIEQTYIEYLQELLTKEEMKNCGVYIKPSLGLCNLYSILNDSVGDDGSLYTLGSYLIYKLTGNNICHITNAAPLGLTDVSRGIWNTDVIHKVGFQNMIFPKIAESDFEICGTYLSNGQELKIYPDYGDQQSAILGCMGKQGDVVINIATASQVSTTVNKFITGNYETRPYFEGKYINTISNMPSGRNLEVLIQFLKQVVFYFTAEELEEQEIWNKVMYNYCDNTKGLTVNTLFYSTPNNGSIEGITTDNLNINTIFSAAFKNMSQIYFESASMLFENGKEEIERFICAGGVSRKRPELLEQIKKVSNKECVLPLIPDEALSGLFRIALVCSGICKNLDDRPELQLKIEGEK